MGIDVYLKWPRQTAKEKKAQYTGFSVLDGHNGYLREAYHGGPYATRYLMSEAFNDKGEAKIMAAVLRARLPGTILLALYRGRKLYDDPVPPEMSDAIKDLAAREAVVEQLYCFHEAELAAALVLIASRNMPDHIESFVAFVELAERMEAKTGKPCTVIASY